MSQSWKATWPCTRDEAEALTEDGDLFADLVQPPALIAQEPDESQPDRWELSAYFESRPPAILLKRISGRLGAARRDRMKLEQLPDEDWVTLSQSGLEPVHAGRFFVHTTQFAGDAPVGSVRFRIDAGLAFGTGGHATTTGCLAMLDGLARNGQRFTQIADIGTGTGILAFAARHVWPRARVIASDIDPISVQVAAENAALNHVPVGRAVGQVALVPASGTDHPLIKRRAPYDLIIANILAGPLIELAPAFACLMADGGSLILAGLLEAQKEAVIAACQAQGLKLVDSQSGGEWPVLRLIKRPRYGWRRPLRTTGRTSQPPGDFGSW